MSYSTKNNFFFFKIQERKIASHSFFYINYNFKLLYYQF